MNIQKRKVKIPVYFECEYEIHPLKKFQAEGHFVPALRERDALGQSTMQPRKWKGNHVHALTLFDSEKQIIRALSDSREDAERILGEQLRQAFYGAQRALAIVGFNSDQARLVKDERDRLVSYMIANGKPEDLSKALGIGEAAVEEFKQAEKSPLLRARVDAMLGGGV